MSRKVLHDYGGCELQFNEQNDIWPGAFRRLRSSVFPVLVLWWNFLDIWEMASLQSSRETEKRIACASLIPAQEILKA